MKEYRDKIETEDYDVVVSTNKGAISLSLDMGCEAFRAELSSKEVDTLITMLKEAKKKVSKQ